nr:unnamed protein product [Callosobruchus analis]
MLHFSDKEQCPEGDRLFKVQSLVDSLNEKFKNNIMCDENVCIDETMVPFRGRLKFRQYIKGKRHKFGIKLFKLCMSGGYLLHAKIYCGQDKVDGMSVSSIPNGVLGQFGNPSHPVVRARSADEVVDNDQIVTRRSL